MKNKELKKFKEALDRIYQLTEKIESIENETIALETEPGNYEAMKLMPKEKLEASLERKQLIIDNLLPFVKGEVRVTPDIPSETKEALVDIQKEYKDLYSLADDLLEEMQIKLNSMSEQVRKFKGIKANIVIDEMEAK